MLAGLNLTGADTCVFHDLDFNPATDRQVKDRAHPVLGSWGENHAGRGWEYANGGKGAVRLPRILVLNNLSPATDRQAEDRAHRVGQTRDVTIYKLVTSARPAAKSAPRSEIRRALLMPPGQSRGSTLAPGHAIAKGKSA